MASFQTLPNGVQILATEPTGTAGDVLSDNFRLIDSTIGQLATPQHYQHNQTTPATVWTVVHNLGRYPSNVAVISTTGDVIYDTIERQAIIQAQGQGLEGQKTEKLKALNELRSAEAK